MKIGVIFGVLVAILLFSGIAKTYAQQNRSWEIWSQSTGSYGFGSGWNTGTAKLYKVQDGTCAIYVGIIPNEHDDSIALTTGQGCK